MGRGNEDDKGAPLLEIGSGEREEETPLSELGPEQTGELESEVPGLAPQPHALALLSSRR